MSHEHGGTEAEDRDNGYEDPGAFFQEIRGLPHSHGRTVEAAKSAGKPPTFRVLHQHEQAQQCTRQQNDYPYENQHFMYFLFD